MATPRYLALAIQPSIIARGLKFSVIVGSILVLINHGDTIFTSGITSTQWLQIALTYLVPYLVSSLSSVQALLNDEG